MRTARSLLAVLALVTAGACQDATAPKAPSHQVAPAEMLPSLIVAPLGPCTFTVFLGTEYLNADCVTTVGHVVNYGSFNGNGHTIHAKDPVGGAFIGAVLSNATTVTSLNIINVSVTGDNLTVACHSGYDRLAGIRLHSASGSIRLSKVYNLRQINSGCQEGNSIEVKNEPFDGTHPHTLSVEISGSTVTDFMKTGILANGDVNINAFANTVGASANQAYLAANSIQAGFGAKGNIWANTVAGNQWCTAPGDDATAVLIYQVDGLNITGNRIRGNSDVGLYLVGRNITATANDVLDDKTIADCNQTGDDIGIGNYPASAADSATVKLSLNSVGASFAKPYDGVAGKFNRVNPHK